MDEPEVSVVLPALNEEKTVRVVIDRILSVFDREAIAGELILVDGHSSDRTGAIADEIAERDKRVRVIRLGPDAPGNLGISLRQGFRSARGKYIVALDCDLSHDADEIPNLLSRRGEADLIIGSRFVKGGKAELSWKRYMLTRTYNFMAKHLLGVKINDLTTGFRVYRKAMLDRIELASRGFGIQVEAIVKARMHNWQVIEVPIHYRKSDKKSTLIYRKQFASYMLPLLLGVKARFSMARAARN
ncbi:MAG TPA: glycosyltransferase family 2 protein [Candidatus Binatia bacterium]|nr:glycosyltransferase family 2 protein [Candidatus Binatia bacterium]